MLKKVITITAGVLIVINTLIVAVMYFNDTKTAFIDYNKVYNNCKLKTSLEKDLERLTNQRKSELDSMQLQLSFLSQEVSSGKTSTEKLNEFEDMKNRFLTLQQRYQEENLRLKEAYFAQIRKEINEKSQAYATAHNYDYFFAAMGDGALMYGSETEDVTSDFQKYLDQNQ